MWERWLAPVSSLTRSWLTLMYSASSCEQRGNTCVMADTHTREVETDGDGRSDCRRLRFVLQTLEITDFIGEMLLQDHSL